MEMKVITKNVEKVEYSCLLPFQNGFLLSNAALQSLLPYLKEKFPNGKIDYIITRRLNQDIVENFFSTIRGILPSTTSLTLLILNAGINGSC